MLKKPATLTESDLKIKVFGDLIFYLLFHSVFAIEKVIKQGPQTCDPRIS